MSDTSDYVLALARYRDAVEYFPEIEVKGKANPYTSMNGNMFSFLDKQGTLCLRVSKDDRAGLMQAYGTDPVVQHGAIMKEYVELPQDVVCDPIKLRAAFEVSVAYARLLKPKPTKRK